eukprot:scaffold10193_cov107-Isochrysis_galbana.AAC.10
MRQDTLLFSGGQAPPPFPPPSLYLFPRRATYYLRCAEKKQNSASAWRLTMAPRQPTAPPGAGGGRHGREKRLKASPR